MGEHFASGNWVVRAGREDDFVARWKEFLEWTRASAPGLVSARLIRDGGDSRHFISFAIWESAQMIEKWRSLPGFGTRLSACRELCDDFRGSSYTVAATA
jgi:heme-degrading monooxygenase HmoA